MRWSKLLLAVSAILVGCVAMSAQSFEITPFVGGQINGSLDYSTTLFHGLDVENGLSYGVTGGYLFGEYYGL